MTTKKNQQQKKQDRINTYYEQIMQVIKACNAPLGASRKASGGGGGGGGNGGSDNRFASVEIIRNFLDGHIRLRYNFITQKLSSQKIDKAFSDLGFKKFRTTSSRGFHRQHPK